MSLMNYDVNVGLLGIWILNKFEEMGGGVRKSPKKIENSTQHPCSKNTWSNNNSLSLWTTNYWPFREKNLWS